MNITLTENSRISNVDFSNLQFGQIFSDHMFVCDYVNGEWSNQRILPYSDIKVSPSSRVFHYGQAIFEGMKAYKDDNDGIWLFRPDENFKRFNISSKRLAIPEIPKKVFFEGLNELLKIDKEWIKKGNGNSLYVRPFVFASEPSINASEATLTSLTLVTTCLAAAAGGIGAALFSGLLYKNLDLTMFMNGVLGGLVGITAGADQMLPGSAILIGLIAGVIVVLSVALLDKCKLDDPVGAIPVHLFCGIWGTLAVGIFGELAGFDQFMVQLACIGITGVFCVIGATIITLFVKAIAGLRVDEKEEVEGLDIAEHGTSAYGDFSIR